MDIDWQEVRFFYHIATSGSVSAASRELNVSQPTLSRQIQQLEEKLSTSLFQRSTQGVTLTEAGQSLLGSARAMFEASQQFSLVAKGHEQALKGDIRISANEIVGHYLLPQAITAFLSDHPEVNIEIVIDNKATNLAKREADIAWRMFPPTQKDLVVRKLPSIPLGFFAHKDYLSKLGTPVKPQDLANHVFVGFDSSTAIIDAASSMGIPIQRKDFAIRSDSLIQHLAYLKSGAGIVVTHKAVGKMLEDVEAILPVLPLPPLSCYLVAHSDVQLNPRIKSLMRFLGEWFTDQYDYNL